MSHACTQQQSLNPFQAIHRMREMGEKQPSLATRQRAPRLQTSNAIEQPPHLGEVGKDPRRSLPHAQRPDEISKQAIRSSQYEAQKRARRALK